jgi:hypothetical protein
VPQLAPSNRITAGQLDHKTPGTLDKRLAARAEHMEGLREMKADGRVVDGGAMLDKDGKMVGSVMLLNFPDRAAHVIGLYNTAYRMQWTVGRFCGCVMCEPTESGRFWGRRWLMNETQAINGGRPGAGDWRDGSVDDTLTIVDAHHHLWDLTALHYPWLDDAIVEDFMLGDYSRLRRNYCPGDYRFRNIKGGYLDFSECFADEGSVDMAASIRAYREVGYDGIPFPDHVPVSDLDPARERFFGFALGYTRGLLQAIPA